MRLPKFLTYNVVVKLSSVVLAVIVWMMVQGEVTMEKVFHGVRYKLEMSPSMVVTARDVEVLRVTLVGPRDTMQEVTSRAIHIVQDLREMKAPGLVRLSIAPEDIEVPQGVQVLDVHPKQLSITLDELVEKELPVKAQFVGKLEKGYQMKDFTINPSVVTVVGAKQKLEKLSAIETRPVILTGRTRSFVQTAPLRPLFKKHNPAQQVDVYVKVEQEMTQRVVENIPVVILQGPIGTQSFRLTTSVVRAHVEGPKDWLDKIRATDLKAFIDITELKPGKYQLPVNIMPIQGVTVTTIEPDVVEVEIFGKLEGI